MIKLVEKLFEGSGYITQLFGNKLYINSIGIYGQYMLLGHNGIDYSIPTNNELYSCINGKVIEAQVDSYNKCTGGYGMYVKIENSSCGMLYAHMNKLNVKVGDTIKAGHVLGLSGTHLHLGVHPIPRNRNNGYNGYINPFDDTLIEWLDEKLPG